MARERACVHACVVEVTRKETRPILRVLAVLSDKTSGMKCSGRGRIVLDFRPLFAAEFYVGRLNKIRFLISTQDVNHVISKFHQD